MLRKIRTTARYASLLSRSGRGVVNSALYTERGAAFAETYAEGARCAERRCSIISPAGELESYFEAHKTGRGIWKWRHYFDIYERHLARFRGRSVSVCEIGVFSGGSLDMWKTYFGPQCQVFGVDIEPACAAYADERTTILIGDQADRSFWDSFRQQAPSCDVVIDDGGHQVEQQIVTLEELLPHLAPGGVYICEDVHGQSNHFAAYVQGLIAALNSATWVAAPADANGGTSSENSPFQRSIRAIHSYPFMTVIEKNDEAVEELVSPKRGTEWQPFL